MAATWPSRAASQAADGGLQHRCDGPAAGRQVADRRQPADSPLLEVLATVVELRRQVQALQPSGVVLRLQNEIARLKHAEQQRAKRKKRRREPESSSSPPSKPRLLARKSLLKRIDRLAREIIALEDDRSAGSTPADRRTAAPVIADHEPTEHRAARPAVRAAPEPGRGQPTALIVAIYRPVAAARAWSCCRPTSSSPQHERQRCRATG